MKRNNTENYLIGDVFVLEICFLVLMFCMFSSCKSPQKITNNSKQKQEIKIENDISSFDEKRMKEQIDRLIKKMISEQLFVDIKNVKYDTSLPVDSATGKHPVAEETDVKIKRKTDISETDSTHQEKDSISATKIDDNSTSSVKTNSEIKEEKKTGLNDLQKKMIGAGVFSFLLLAFFIIIKLKK